MSVLYYYSAVAKAPLPSAGPGRQIQRAQTEQGSCTHPAAMDGKGTHTLGCETDPGCSMGDCPVPGQWGGQGCALLVCQAGLCPLWSLTRVLLGCCWPRTCGDMAWTQTATQRKMMWWEMGTLLLGTLFLSPSDGRGNLSVRVAADPPKGRMGSILVWFSSGQSVAEWKGGCGTVLLFWWGCTHLAIPVLQPFPWSLPQCIPVLSSWSYWQKKIQIDIHVPSEDEFSLQKYILLS